MNETKDKEVPIERTPWQKFVCAVTQTLVAPIEFIHGMVVPFQATSKWYHQKFGRVPTIDQCEQDDAVCFAEANMQYRRDRLVDTEIIGILRQRFEDCVLYETPDHLVKCAGILKQYEDASANWFTKYGDIGGYHNVLKCYMKQKHRMLWEQKYGEVGKGMDSGKIKEIEDEDDSAHKAKVEEDDDPCKKQLKDEKP